LNYRSDIKPLNDIKNNNDAATAAIDRAIEATYIIIQQASHIMIELLNLDARLELFNFYNFKFLGESTPEVESLKTVYNKLNK